MNSVSSTHLSLKYKGLHHYVPKIYGLNVKQIMRLIKIY